MSHLIVVDDKILAKIIGTPTKDPYMGRVKVPANDLHKCECVEIHLFDMGTTEMNEQDITTQLGKFVTHNGVITSVYIWDPKWTFVNGVLCCNNSRKYYGNGTVTFYNNW